MKKFLATLCAIFFVLFAPLTIIATIVQVKIFTPQGLKMLVRATRVGEQLPQLLSSVFISQIQKESEQSVSAESADPFNQFGGQAVFEDAISKVLPPADVYGILDQVVDTTFIWWKTSQPIQNLPLVIDLSQPKQRIAPIVLESVKQRVESLPTCTTDQLKEMVDSNLPDIFSLACTPQGFTFESFSEAGISEEALSAILLASVPNEFNIQEFLQQMQLSDPGQLREINQRVDSVRNGLHIAYIILRILQITTLVSFLCVGFLRLLPAKAFFAWTGWTLFLPGAELLILSTINIFIPTIVGQNILEAYPEVAEVIPIVQLTSTLMETFSRPILWIGIGMTLVGLTAIIFGKIIKHRQANKSIQSV